jgi:DNA (cytosine-5)-methyltransferase 1
MQNEHGGRDFNINRTFPTITANGRAFSVVEPLILPQNQGYDKLNVRTAADPMSTILTSGAEALCEPFVFKRGDDEYILDIRYRMLQPMELAKAMGFPENYLWYGSKTQVVRQIGNAVPVNTAKAIIKCLMEQTICRRIVV